MSRRSQSCSKATKNKIKLSSLPQPSCTVSRLPARRSPPSPPPLCLVGATRSLPNSTPLRATDREKKGAFLQDLWPSCSTSPDIGATSRFFLQYLRFTVMLQKYIPLLMRHSDHLQPVYSINVQPFHHSEAHLHAQLSY